MLNFICEERFCVYDGSYEADRSPQVMGSPGVRFARNYAWRERAWNLFTRYETTRQLSMFFHRRGGFSIPQIIKQRRQRTALHFIVSSHQREVLLRCTSWSGASKLLWRFSCAATLLCGKQTVLFDSRWMKSNFTFLFDSRHCFHCK